MAATVLAPNASAHHSPYLGIAATWGEAEFGQVSPQAVATGADGSVYTLQVGTAPMFKRFDREGNLLAEWGERPGDPVLDGPQDIAVGASGALYVTASSGNEVVKFSPNGDLLARWDGANGTPAFDAPAGITTDTVGNVYVALAGPDDGAIVQVTEDGTFVKQIGAFGFWFFYLARDSEGFFYGPAAGQIQRLDSSGARVGTIGFLPLGPELGHFGDPYGPRGVAVAPDNSTWATDWAQGRVQRFSRDGKLLDVCSLPPGGGTVNDVAADGASIVVVDGNQLHRIGTVTRPAAPCDAIPPELTDVELLIKGGPRRWFKRSAVQFETSKPAHATLKLQQRVRRHNRRRWRGLDRGRANLQTGANTVDFSDVLDVNPKPRAGRYRMKLQLDDEADNLSRERKRKFRIP